MRQAAPESRSTQQRKEEIMTLANHQNSKKTKNAGVSPTAPKAHQKANVEKDLRQDVTDRIIELMEGGVIEWKKSWRTAAESGIPKNAVTGMPYRGINIVLLWMAAFQSGFTSNKWMTFLQAKQLGANVIKGQKGTYGIKYKLVEKKDAKEGEPEFYPMTKPFYVYNLDQIENLPENFKSDPALLPNTFVADDVADKFLNATGAIIEHRGNAAFYSPVWDKIVLPQREAFESTESYYATAFHELVHWTGQTGRLNRLQSTTFGDDEYIKEELVAELGSAFVAAEFGFVDATVHEHASYLDSWIKILKEDKTAIFKAAKQASAAYEYLLQVSDTPLTL